MADNIVSGSENVYSKQVGGNVVLIDPNKVVSVDGTVIKDRLVRQEDLVMYVNLTAKVIPRSKLISARGASDASVTVSLHDGEINFLKPQNKSSLDSDWTEAFTDTNVNKIKRKQDVSDKGQTFTSKSIDSRNDFQGFGIRSIEINISSSFVPEVNIDFVDIRGKTLFEQAEANTPYTAFFHLPYPVFELTIKGYYGKAVKYQLALTNFTTSFDSSTGDFKMRGTFIGNHIALLNDINVQQAMLAPYMYPNLSSGVDGELGESLGRKTLNEVYNIYKLKKLIPQDFPHLTINELIEKVDKFTDRLGEKLNKVDLQFTNDQKLYSGKLKDLYNSIFGQDGWVSTFITKDESEYIPLDITISSNNQNINEKSKKAVAMKLKAVDDEYIKNAESKLEYLLEGYKKVLNENRTFGKLGGKGAITSIDNFTVYNQRAKNNQANNLDQIPAKGYYVLDVTPKSFGGTYTRVFEEFDKNFKDIQTSVTEKLNKTFIEVLEFYPSMRNLSAVLISGVDTYLRLMDNVHTKAFDQRFSEKRIESVTGPTKAGFQDTPSRFENQCFPWPQYYESNDETGELVLTYPGASGSLSKTEAYNPLLWPEIQFIEEYTKVANFKEADKVFPTINEATYLGSIPISVREYPFNDKVYDNNKTKNDILWEIVDRAEDFVNYVGVSGYKSLASGEKSMTDTVLEASKNDSKNLTKILESDFKMSEFFSGNNLKWDSLFRELKKDSPERYENWENNVINTLYIRNKNLQNTSIPGTNYGLYATSTIFNTNVDNGEYLKYVDLYRKGKKTEDGDFDFYPFNFRNINQLKVKLADSITITGQKFYDIDKLTIPSASRVYGTTNHNYFFTNWNWKSEIENIDLYNQVINELSVVKSFTTKDNWSAYYDTKQDILNQSLTEGINNLSESLSRQSVSMLNTPWFANAIYRGGQNVNAGNTTGAYSDAAYLYLNSLPITSTLEKTIIGFSGKHQYGGYVAQLIKQLASYHELPYSFILKIGSLWWNYKNETPEEFSVFGGLGSGDGGTMGNDGDIRCNEWYVDPAYSNGYGWFDYSDNGNVLPGLDINQQTLGLWPRLISMTHNIITGSNILPTVGTWVPVQDLQTNFLGGYIMEIVKEEIPKVEVDGVEYSFYTTYADSNNIPSGFGVQELDPATNPYYILYPSSGGLVNSDLEYIGDNITTAAFDGSARFLWAGAGFGSFDVKSGTNYGAIYGRVPWSNYFKRVNNAKVEQDAWSINLTTTTSSNYESFNELLSIFPTQVLEKFEDEFIKFSTTKNPNASIVDGQYTSFIEIFKKIMVVPKEYVTEITGNITHTTQDIANAQLSQFLNINDVFLNQTIIYKHGSVNGFDIITRLDGQGGGTPTNQLIGLLLDKGKIKESYNLPKYIATDWPVGYLDVQFQMEIGEVVMTKEEFGTPTQFQNVCNLCFQFFVNFDISPITVFSFAQILKYYVTTCANLVTPTSKQDFVVILKNLQDTNFDVERNVYINNFLKEVSKIDPLGKLRGEVDEDPERPKIDGDNLKLELYQSFKTFNDKWIAGTEVQGSDLKKPTSTSNGGVPYYNTIFERFLFLDRRNMDIGNEAVGDIYVFKGLALASESPGSVSVNQNISAFMSNMCRTNFFNWIPLPSYINFYNIEGNETAKQGNAMFGAFKEVDTTDSSPVYLCQYVGPPSTNLDIKTPTYGFNNDSFILDRVSPNPLINNKPPTDPESLNLENKVMAFAVDFGIPNQQIFQDISLDQTEFPNTSESFIIIEDMGKLASGSKVATNSLNLFNLYKSRSYQCKVTCFGNALIQPTTYFQLRYIPMFSGPYLIMDVNHSISNGEMTTTFTGVRVGIPSLPKVTDLLSGIQETLLKNLKESETEDVGNVTDGLDSFDLVGNSITQLNDEEDIIKINILGIEVKDPVNLSKIVKPSGAQIFEAKRKGRLHKGVDYSPKQEFKGEEIAITSPVTGILSKKYGGCKVGTGKACGGGYGNHVYITRTLIKQTDTSSWVKDAVSKYEFVLAHFKDKSFIANNVGTAITKGQFLGNMGNTGNSSGTHLHYEIRRYVIDENLSEKMEYLNPDKFDSDYITEIG
tara:strand:+ start:10057 stop:16266 length:6210 start_codon:yes stop_codon:yes gene_type:complete